MTVGTETDDGEVYAAFTDHLAESPSCRHGVGCIHVRYDEARRVGEMVEQITTDHRLASPGITKRQTAELIEQKDPGRTEIGDPPVERANSSARREAETSARPYTRREASCDLVGPSRRVEALDLKAHPVTTSKISPVSLWESISLERPSGSSSDLTMA